MLSTLAFSCTPGPLKFEQFDNNNGRGTQRSSTTRQPAPLCDFFILVVTLPSLLLCDIFTFLLLFSFTPLSKPDKTAVRFC